MGKVHAINLSAGGVPKLPVLQAWLGSLGFEGDGHHDRKLHGGPDRAVSLWALEIIDGLRQAGHPIYPGAAGENLTLSGIDWTRAVPGARLHVGAEVELEVVSYCSPCTTIEGCFSDGDYSRISHKRLPGTSRVYARVLGGGWVATGDDVRLWPAPLRPTPE